ncbi:P-loop containing nucleoside triphosphate hydrolase protein [Parachaetomium inaequale]|uniref:P-loop containing nucleoside triphosphate hydrolase protein n=1 Tax=Parachaetomium inaequale TaxID=2588326 RepID=A0AAN6PC58_9PEZI|nr:P-loop containing nucleoside triphosphate hydrolase protein [Parachaetomium inaequale]
MGLGKTVQTLACISGNPPSQEDEHKGMLITLLVVPPNAVQQWISEIYKHCDGTHACQYKASAMDQGTRESFPIWVASYDEVSKDYPDDDMIKESEHNKALTSKQCQELRPKYCGLLLQMQFYRAVLDEGHAIKNPASKSEGMGTKFLEHALFDLPRAHVLKRTEVKLSREETIIYRQATTLIVEDKFRECVTDDLNDADEGPPKKGKFWMIYVLRLRQAASHPFLLENLMKTVFELEDIEWLIEQLKTVQTKAPFIDQIGRWCEEQLRVRQADSGASDTEKSGLAASFDMIPHLEGVRRLVAQHLQVQDFLELCRRCGNVPEDPYNPKCGHAVCKDCIESALAEEGTVGRKEQGCRGCKELLDNIRDARGRPRETQPASKAGRGQGRRVAATRPRGRGDDINRIQPRKYQKSLFLAGSDRDLSLSLPPSAKTITWAVFTEFVVTGRLIGRMLQDENINFLYYFGSMSRGEKTKEIQDFTQQNDIHVLALNLACANRVILLDHWWNSLNEQQAFGRVHRMGQDKENFARIVAKNTIDERLVQIQQEKLKMVSEAIEEHDSSKNTISAEDLASFFGRLVRDPSGKIIDIVPDYDDDIDQGEEEATGADDVD